MNKQPVILDFGSRFVKTKTQGNDDPILIPSFVGFQRFHHMTFVDDKNGPSYGSKVAKYGSLFVQQSILNAGTIEDYDYFLEFLSHTLFNEEKEKEKENEKQLNIKESPLFVLNSLSFDRNLEQKERLCEIFFETFQAPSLIYSLSSPFNLNQGSGQTHNFTGISLEMGHSVTEIVPIIDGVPKYKTTKNNNNQNNNLYNFGGKNVNERLTKSINKSFFDFQFQTSNDLQIIERFKESNCFVNLKELNILQDFKKEIVFVFPNEQTRKIENNKILSDCCEPYFNSNLLPNNNNNNNNNKQNLPERMISIIKPFTFEHRHLLLQNIILSGGSSLIRNFDKRLEYELNNLLIKLIEEEQGQKENENRILPNLQCKINNHNKENQKFQQCLSLVNASSLLESQDSDFLKKFIQFQEWDEIGVNILKKKNKISFQNCLKVYKNEEQEKVTNQTEKQVQEQKKENEQKEDQEQKKGQEEEEYFSNYFLNKETINYSYKIITQPQKTYTEEEDDDENELINSRKQLFFDLGSSTIKVGFCGEDAPRAFFPTIVGSPKFVPLIVGVGQRDKFIGDEAQVRRGSLKLNKPIQRGIPVHWGYYEKLLHHTYYNELKVTPQEHLSYFSIHPRFPKKELGKINELLFENFEIKNSMFCLDNYLNLLTTGQQTGLMVSIGGEVTSIAPFYNSNIIESGIRKVNFGGRDVTNYLNKLISMSQYQATTESEFEIIRDIKEKSCFVSLNYLDDLQLSNSSTKLEFKYENPDVNKITLNKERFQASELLFQPSLDNLQIKPIHELIVESIMSCPIDFQKELFSNIYIFGGSTLLKNFTARLGTEIKKIIPKKIKIKLNAPLERKFSTWIGGSLFGDLLAKKNSLSLTVSNTDFYSDKDKNCFDHYYFKSTNNIFQNDHYNIGKSCYLSDFHKKIRFFEKDSHIMNGLKRKEQQQYLEKNVTLQKKLNSINEKSIKLNSVINDLNDTNKEYLLQLKKLKEEIKLNK
ncbi:actin-7-related [Anaeramoeba flamelloides]|uniref:Actin-7-related n=1 Tax=Anaeramoeba flamelloides TaxID=1746091 RepID=A0ABQ8YUN5_9EUKA|nr:actin-7-related [Anaeramoeba flamelloides]